MAFHDLAMAGLFHKADFSWVLMPTDEKSRLIRWGRANNSKPTTHRTTLVE